MRAKEMSVPNYSPSITSLRYSIFKTEPAPLDYVLSLFQIIMFCGFFSQSTIIVKSKHCELFHCHMFKISQITHVVFKTSDHRETEWTVGGKWYRITSIVKIFMLELDWSKCIKSIVILQFFVFMIRYKDIVNKISTKPILRWSLSYKIT